MFLDLSRVKARVNRVIAATRATLANTTKLCHGTLIPTPGLFAAENDLSFRLCLSHSSHNPHTMMSTLWLVVSVLVGVVLLLALIHRDVLLNTKQLWQHGMAVTANTKTDAALVTAKFFLGLFASRVHFVNRWDEPTRSACKPQSGMSRWFHQLPLRCVGVLMHAGTGLLMPSSPMRLSGSASATRLACVSSACTARGSYGTTQPTTGRHITRSSSKVHACRVRTHPLCARACERAGRLMRLLRAMQQRACTPRGGLQAFHLHTGFPPLPPSTCSCPDSREEAGVEAPPVPALQRRRRPHRAGGVAAGPRRWGGGAPLP